MSSRPRKHRRVEPHAMSASRPGEAEIKVMDAAQHQKIQIRAYEISNVASNTAVTWMIGFTRNTS